MRRIEQKQNEYRIEGKTAILLCPRRSRGKHALELIYEVKIDCSDLERVLAFGFWRVGEYGRNLLYARHQVKQAGEPNQTTLLHRFLLGVPAGMQVDHRHHLTLDNRRSEIWIATPSQNQQNRRLRRGVAGLNARLKELEGLAGLEPAIEGVEVPCVVQLRHSPASHSTGAQQ